jgi:hypothetical protein
MYSKTKAAMVSSLALIAVAMLFATGPLVANHAFAYGSDSDGHHHYGSDSDGHHHSYHHHSHHHYYHHYHHSD